MIAQQLVFGYRDGHRRLGGSAELDKAAAGALLGATDASVGPRTKRLITALPLPSVGLYSLSGTWPAPEGGRPGAVWAHALLVPLDQLGDLNALEALASKLRRPSPDDLADYVRPLDLGAHASLSPQTPQTALLAQILAAVTEPDGVTVVAATDLAGGEAALFALWDSAWPDLRAALSFRTRERVKAAPRLGYLCVARRVSGMWRPQPTTVRSRAAALAESGWVRELAEVGSEQRREGDLRAFLRAFGPEGPPQVARLVSLGELHADVHSGKVGRVAQGVASEYPKATDGAALKRELFGSRHAEWWQVSELELIVALFGVPPTSFDLKSLELRPRVRGLVKQGYAMDLVQALPQRGSKRFRAILLEALVHEASPSLLSDVLGADPALGQDVVQARPELLERTETWSIATDDQARALVEAVELSDRAIAAAVVAGRFSALKPVVSVPMAALRLARAGEFKALRKLFDERSPAEALAGEHAEELRIQLASTGIQTGSIPDLLDALESRRDQVDEAWLRAAVAALVGAGRKRLRATLEVVFGPLHHAITDNRLPHELWAELSSVTPPGDNPALRLRQLLIATARDEGWPSEALARALRGSGPQVKELKKEIEGGGGKDDPFIATAKVALKTLKRVIP